MPDLNGFLGGGLRPGTLTVVGSRPGLGKSLIGASLATHVALHHDQAALVASLEINRLELVQRMPAAGATVPLAGINGSRSLTERDWDRIGQHTSTLADAPIAIDDNPTQTPGSLRAKMRDLSRRSDLGIVIVDYLQLLTPRDRRVSGNSRCQR